MKLILGFAAAREPQQLGYDPSIRRIPTPLDDARYEGPVYEIDVQTGKTGEVKSFVTRRIIASYAPDAMLGRGTRVWIVITKEDFLSGKQDCEE